jgi:RNA recognition motif-containing protein
MDETYLHDCFAYTQDLLSLKIIRNKQTGESEGYGFLEFASHAAAQMALQNYNGEQFYRLNWATFGIRQKRPEDYTIFVGDLAYDVTDDLLQETFRAIYPSVKGAKVITDTATGRSKGYGFVDFGNANEQLRAMTEMNGMPCSSRPMRIGPTKKNTVYQQPYPKVVASASANDSNNTTLFVAGLDPTVTVEMLTQSFVQFGELVHVNIPVGKRFGFVQFSNRASAEVALQTLDGAVLGRQPIRLSWGRNLANKQVQRGGWPQIQQPDPNQWNGGVQGYSAGYGYVTQPQDPNQNMYKDTVLVMVMYKDTVQVMVMSHNLKIQICTVLVMVMYKDTVLVMVMSHNLKIQICTVISLQMQTISNRIQTISNKIQTCTVITLQMQTISNKIQQKLSATRSNYVQL